MEIIKRNGTILIDDEDAGLLEGWRVHVVNNRKTRSPGYACLRKQINGKQITKSLSRLIMGEPQGLEVDHINHNTLDNCKCNLRICTRSENARNNQGHSTRTGSKYKGVYFQDTMKYEERRKRPLVKPWRAYTRLNGKRVWFGYYATEEEAALAYNIGAKRLFGEFACLNDLPEGTTEVISP